MLLVTRQSKDDGRSKVVLIGVDNNKVMTTLIDRVVQYNLILDHLDLEAEGETECVRERVSDLMVEALKLKAVLVQ